MVNVRKLRAHMALKGISQKELAAAVSNCGVKMSENTLSSRMKRKSNFDCEEVDVICEILDIHDPAEKASIFLA